MRLIHTQDLTFQEFFNEERPLYAILSHRWTKHELTYKQYVESSYHEGAGIGKIRKACAEALRRGYKWLWVDTICIDKSSSAELSEAINSMWRWYHDANLCLAYLFDVEQNDDANVVCQQFTRSEWFQRGWTLQELLAPYTVLFLDCEWKCIGYKSFGIQNYHLTKEGPEAAREEKIGNVKLMRLISCTTGIGMEYLTRDKSIFDASVAIRMSWASRRKTTRIEDQAYCLLGLFEVNMPLLYGEGKDAFFRFQLEILRNSDDESMFAWRADRQLHGLLAESARDFATASNIQKLELAPEQRLPWAWTNKGLELRIADRTKPNNHDPMPPGNLEQIVYLGCYIEGGSRSNEDDTVSPWLQSIQSRNHQQHSYIAISIRRFGNAWFRMRCGGFYLDAGFQSISRSLKAPLVYKYYYVPRRPNLAALSEYMKLTDSSTESQVRMKVDGGEKLS